MTRRKAIATVCLSGTLDEKLAAAAAAGFDAVELFENDLIGSPHTPAQVRERAAALGLDLALYQPFRDFEAVDDAQLERNLRRAEAKLDVMEELGMTLMLATSNVQPTAIDDDELAAHQLGLLADRAAARGMRIAYEALAWGRHVSTYEHSWRIAQRADHDALGVCLDSFHILSRGSDPAGIADIPGEKILFVQLADAPHLVMDVLQWSRHYRCFPGQGGFDLAAFCGHLDTAGYVGPLSLEVFNDVFRQADPQRMAVDAMRSLLVLEDELPPAAPLTGHAFVELGADGDLLAGVLEGMGFVHRGPHRTKPVQLWEQGEARIVLNHESAPGVRALAVESADPDGSAQRAEALGAPVLDRRRGAGEADLSSIAAPDGTSVFFTRGTTWRDDFVALGDDAPRFGHGIRDVDHVALTQPFDFFDEAVLFYRSVLGLEPTEPADIAAPDGLLRSRAVEGGGVRLALNVPVHAGGADALQHIAFTTDDALGTVRRMAERGVPLLAVPGNYYDDLAARHELDEHLLADLRALGVLYDRDAGGELLHAYTQVLGGRVFFEVVERRGAYAGYGAANSPVRLAAQRAPVAERVPR